ncbi:MAG: YbaB/EbfC family nucleoid-associated protein [Sedimentisphaerales bacterium]|nr:YbaB/EbfC family nucleoid-associated protein [Sedimentisphaerales bacterium]
MMGFGDLTKMFGQFKDIQANLQRVQEEAAQRVVEASSGGGMVTAKVNGKGELLEIKIDPNVVDVNDLEMMEDLIKAAINAAVTKSQEEMREQMQELTGGLNIPGLDQLGKMFG